MGRSLGNNLHNLGLFNLCQEALRGMGVELADIEESESDAALGNGGLGRLAACFLDSMATLDMPGYGYGIHYEYGLFRQEISNGYQREKPDNWLAYGTPWEIERAEEACLIPVYGRVEHALDRKGHYNPMWMDWKILVGVPYDFPIVGYGGRTVNYLRLYCARSSADFDMQIFNDIIGRMIPRPDAIKRIAEVFRSHSIAAILGPSQCGKTALARMFAGKKSTTYFDLENPVDHLRLSAPMNALTGLSGLVVIDEIQASPNC